MKSSPRNSKTPLILAFGLILSRPAFCAPDFSATRAVADAEVKGFNLSLYVPQIYYALSHGKINDDRDCPGRAIYLDAYARKDQEPIFWARFKSDESKFAIVWPRCHNFAESLKGSKPQREYYLGWWYQPIGDKRRDAMKALNVAKWGEVTTKFNQLIVALQEGGVTVDANSDQLEYLRNLYRNRALSSLAALGDHEALLKQRGLPPTMVVRVQSIASSLGPQTKPQPAPVADNRPAPQPPAPQPSPATRRQDPPSSPSTRPVPPAPAQKAPVAAPRPKTPEEIQALKLAEENAEKTRAWLKDLPYKDIKRDPKTGRIISYSRKRTQLEQVGELHDYVLKNGITDKDFIAGVLIKLNYRLEDAYQFASNFVKSQISKNP